MTERRASDIESSDDFDNFVRLEPREVFDDFIVGVEWGNPQKPRLVYSADMITEHYRQEMVKHYERLCLESPLPDLDELLENTYMEARQQFHEWCQSAKMGGCNTTDPLYVSVNDLDVLTRSLPEDDKIKVKKVVLLVE